MTTPNQSTPDGSLGTGDFASWQAMTEADAKNKMKIPLGAWNSAQDSMNGSYVRGEYVHREVVRLDNRIDEIVVADQRAQVATFSTDGTWNKPPGAHKIVVDVISGSSGGGRSDNGGSGGSYRGGQGGWSGGWTKLEFSAGELPDTVAIVVGAGGNGATSDGGHGAPGGDSNFGEIASSTGGAYGSFGTGNFSFRIRGGAGSDNYNTPGRQGGAGSFAPGGLGGPANSRGENGVSVDAAKVGMGSGGGGGGGGGAGVNGGRGGDGGWPAGPGGGGGSYSAFGFAGNGGIASGGAVYITSYYQDVAGNPPTQPTNVVASAVAQSTATITWTASTDDVRVEKYVVILGSVEIGETSGTQYHLSQLSGGTQYTVQIVAVDLGNNRSTPGAVTFTTT